MFQEMVNVTKNLKNTTSKKIFQNVVAVKDIIKNVIVNILIYKIQQILVKNKILNAQFALLELLIKFS
jgi:hypothetical protein